MGKDFYYIGKQKIYSKLCKCCGEYYEGVGKDYCSYSCSNKDRDYSAHRRPKRGGAKSRLKPKKDVVCVICGNNFKTSRHNQVCCSEECSKERIHRYNKNKSSLSIKNRVKSFWDEEIWKIEDPKSKYKKDGYIKACFPYVVIPEHRLIMMRKEGRVLERWEHVHHINGIKDDNRIENLKLLNSSDHFEYTKLQMENIELVEENKVLRAKIKELEETRLIESIGG